MQVILLELYNILILYYIQEMHLLETYRRVKNIFFLLNYLREFQCRGHVITTVPIKINMTKIYYSTRVPFCLLFFLLFYLIFKVFYVLFLYNRDSYVLIRKNNSVPVKNGLKYR